MSHHNPKEAAVAWFKKNKIVYRLKGREQGHLEAFAAQRSMADAQYHATLEQIMKRESIPATDKIAFDPQQMAFVKVEKTA